MEKKNDEVTFTVTADTLDEAAECALLHLQELTVQGGHRGFMVPELTAEFVLADPWRRCFEFTASFLPARG